LKNLLVSKKTFHNCIIFFIFIHIYVPDWFQFSEHHYPRVYCICHENCWVFTNIVNGSWPQWVQFYRIRCASLMCYQCSHCITDCIIKISIIMAIYHLLTRTLSIMQIEHYRRIIFQRELVKCIREDFLFLCSFRPFAAMDLVTSRYTVVTN